MWIEAKRKRQKRSSAIELGGIEAKEKLQSVLIKLLGTLLSGPKDVFNKYQVGEEWGKEQKELRLSFGWGNYANEELNVLTINKVGFQFFFYSYLTCPIYPTSSSLFVYSCSFS